MKNITKRSHFGTQDDVSLSCVYDPQLAADNLDMLNNKVEENKQKAAERKANRQSGC